MKLGPVLIPGHEGYSVSRDGSIRSVATGRVVASRPRGSMLVVPLYSGKRSLSTRKLVVASFRKVSVEVYEDENERERIGVLDAAEYTSDPRVTLVSVNESAHIDSLIFVTQRDLQRHIAKTDRVYRVLGAGSTAVLQAKQRKGDWATVWSATPASDHSNPWAVLDSLCNLHHPPEELRGRVDPEHKLEDCKGCPNKEHGRG